MKLSDYPKSWPELSKKLRFERAGNKCEKCGAENHKPHPVPGSKVVLTVAHLCRCYPKCGDEAHLQVMCNRCHLNYDREIHLARAAKTRYRKKYKDQQELFER